VRDQLLEIEKEGHITIEKFNNYAKTSMIPALNIFRNGVCRFVTWHGVKVNYVFMKIVVPDMSLNEFDLFDEFSYVQKYCESKLQVWNEI
jgi:hypothetical protein